MITQFIQLSFCCSFFVSTGFGYIANKYTSITQEEKKLTPLLSQDDRQELESLLKLEPLPRFDNERSLPFEEDPIISKHQFDELSQRFTYYRELIRDFLEGSDINKKDPNGWTLLRHAYQTKDYVIVELLLNHGANVNLIADTQTSYPDSSDCLPIWMLAVRDFDPKSILIFLKYGAEINCVTLNGYSALYLAIYGRNIEMVDFLLKCGANPSLTDNNGKTAFDYARQYHLQKILERLYQSEKKANSNHKNSSLIRGNPSHNDKEHKAAATSEKEDYEDYSLPPRLIFLSDKDRGKELKREEIIDGVRYRLFYAPPMEFNGFVIPDLGQDKFGNYYTYRQKYKEKIKSEKKG